MPYQITTLQPSESGRMEITVVKILDELPAECDEEDDAQGWKNYLEANTDVVGRVWICFRTDYDSRNVLGKKNFIELV